MSSPTPQDPLAFIARPTPQLRSAVEQQQKLLPANDFHAMLAAIRSAFEKYSAKLHGCPAGAERAKTLHALLEKELAPASALPLSCGRGCAGCCYYEVEITADEAELLKTAVLAGLPIDRPHLERQAARERKSPAWHAFLAPENRCAFLGDDNACRAYDARPSICRKHLVTSPREACTTTGAAVFPVQILMAEILLSAALSLPNTAWGSLSKLLLQALDSTPAATS